MNAQLVVWQSAVDLVPHVVFLLDRDGRILHSNRAAERWQLGAPDTLTGLTLHDALHQSCSEPCCQLSELGQQAAEALCAGESFSRVTWDSVLNRRLKLTIERTTANANAERAGFAYAIASVEDATADGARCAEPAARAQGEGLAHALSALDHVRTVVVTADAHGQVSYLNAVARTLLPLRAAGEQPEGAPRGSDLRRIVPPAAIREAQRAGSWTGLCVISADDGRTLERMLTLAAFRDPSGQLRGYTIVEPVPADVPCTLACRDIGEAGARYLAAQQLAIQETERRRIAADLHDGLGQSLALLKRSVEEASGALYAGSYEALGNSLSQLASKTQSALSELRRIAMNLRPSMLDDLGIVATLSWFCREFELSYPGIRLERDVRVREADVPEAVKTAVFRILQEATNNAVKYSGASRIRMSFEQAAGQLRLAIVDDGIGFDPAKRAAVDPVMPRGLGLQTMKERAELTGGRCEIRTAPGEGTVIEVSWPGLRRQRRFVAGLPRRTLRVIPTTRPAKRKDEGGGSVRPTWLD